MGRNFINPVPRADFSVNLTGVNGIGNISQNSVVPYLLAKFLHLCLYFRMLRRIFIHADQRIPVKKSGLVFGRSVEFQIEQWEFF